MARLRTLAFEIKDRLEEIPELEGGVVVYRRADIESQFERRMAKTRGRCVIVRLLNAKNESKARTSAYEASYTVTLFSKPTLTAKDAKDADDLTAEIEAKLHGWFPESLPSNRVMRFTAESLTFPDDPQYDVAVLTLRSPLSTLQPVPQPLPTP
jgi:hypothetical protein